MKRIIALFLTAVLFLSTATFSASAATTISVGAGNVSGTAGSIVEVPISLPNNPGICNVGFSVGYDSTALTFKGWSAGAIFAESEIDGTFSANPIIISAYTGKENKTGSGTFIVLQFEIKANTAAGKYPITLSTGKLGGFSDFAENELTPSYSNGSITVSGNQMSGVTVQADDLSNVKIDMNENKNVQVVLSAYNSNGKFISLKSFFASAQVDLSAWSQYKIYGILMKDGKPFCEKIILR